MKVKNFPIFLLLLLLIIGEVFFSYGAWAQTANVIATVKITVCGNEVVEGDEQCDRTDLVGQTCVGLDYDSGTLSCNPDCTFDTTGCTITAPPSGGGGGGGGTSAQRETKIILQGKAYPDAEITILKDGQVAASTKADSQANFKTELTGLTAGVYTFGIWAEDREGRKSITFNFTTNVSSGTITTVSGIFLPPTIELHKTGLKKGEILKIFGQTAPQSEVSIHVESPEKIIKKTTADTEGDWVYPFDTIILDDGAHTVRAKAISPDDLLSTYSNALAFVLGEEEAIVSMKKGDINIDKKVNLVDFSILLYNWGVPKSPFADLNSDGKVNLVDFSILLYYWTG